MLNVAEEVNDFEVATEVFLEEIVRGSKGSACILGEFEKGTNTAGRATL